MTGMILKVPPERLFELLTQVKDFMQVMQEEGELTESEEELLDDIKKELVKQYGPDSS